MSQLLVVVRSFRLNKNIGPGVIVFHGDWRGLS